MEPFVDREAEFIELSLTSHVRTKQEQAAYTNSQIALLLPCSCDLKKVADFVPDILMGYSK